jgi:hypothetical protein
VQAYNGGHRGAVSGYMNLLVNAPQSDLDLVQKDLKQIPAVMDARFGEQQSNWAADW